MYLTIYPLGTRCWCDVESKSMTLIQPRNNVVCPVGSHVSCLVLVLLLLVFPTRRTVRSAHLALSPNASLLSLILPFQMDIRTRKCIQHRWVRRDGLISALVTTSSPRLKDQDWWGWLVLRWAHLAFPTMPYAYNICIVWFVPIWLWTNSKANIDITILSQKVISSSSNVQLSSRQLRLFVTAGQQCILLVGLRRLHRRTPRYSQDSDDVRIWSWWTVHTFVLSPH